MRIDEFMKVISDGVWHLENGMLRDSNDDCPLWHAYRVLDPDDGEAEDYFDAGRRIGLREKTAWAIAEAADGFVESKLRKRLLAAAGVEEAN